MSIDDAEAAVRILAVQFGVPIPPQHMAEAATAWRLMAPHLDRATDREPAALFRP
jgi:hypothetical protein